MQLSYHMQQDSRRIFFSTFKEYPQYFKMQCSHLNWATLKQMTHAALFNYSFVKEAQLKMLK